MFKQSTNAYTKDMLSVHSAHHTEIPLNSSPTGFLIR